MPEHTLTDACAAAREGDPEPIRAWIVARGGVAACSPEEAVQLLDALTAGRSGIGTQLAEARRDRKALNAYGRAAAR